ncbi:hypothetical protein H0H87_003386 [Tephrocybe sp. NHM501043]|nr:hypothetical protein H0H87_003386 [Tephrocybe sp. NHM501043]
MKASTRFRVVICGAGIGGLTAAVALSAYSDIDIEIYEAAAELAEVGAGIGIFPRPWEIIQKLGLEKELLQYTEVKRREGPGNLMLFHRADFQKVLLRRLPKSCKTHCSKRLRSYSQRLSGPIEVVFEDGSSTTCDVLIGADGLKSAVRKGVLREKADWARSEGRRGEASYHESLGDPVWSGTNAYRALIPTEALKRSFPDHKILSRPTQYLGKNGYIIAYPIAQGKFVNFVAFTARHDLENSTFKGNWMTKTNRAEFSGLFTDWEPEVQALISCVEDPLRWAVHTSKPLNSFISGGVALIAFPQAHAMAPHQGSGAGQALEDAYILATVLGHPSTTKDTLHRALDIFDQIRRPPAQQVAENSRRAGQIFTLHGLNLDGLSNNALFTKLKSLSEEFIKIWEWTWTTSIEESRREAIRLLES